MTGVAAQLCGDRKAVESLGYEVDEQGIIYQQEPSVEPSSSRLASTRSEPFWQPFSKLGARRAVLNDLSPAATFIAYNYNTPVDVVAFEREAKRILKEVEDECGWMYETLHMKSPIPVEPVLRGKINYTVWSDVFVCPECSEEVVFWEAAVDKDAGKVHDMFPCPNCKANLTKRNMERAWVTKYDKAIAQNIRQAKQIPVLINYSVGKKRHEKKPDIFDLELIEKIEQMDIPYWFPTNRMPEGYNTKQPKVSHGITHVHHFYTKRNLWVLGSSRRKANSIMIPSLHYWLNSIEHGLGKRVKHGDWSFPMSVLSGTLYIPALSRENNPLYFYETKRQKQGNALRTAKGQGNFMATLSSSCLALKSMSVDYIFTDPPFGCLLYTSPSPRDA